MCISEMIRQGLLEDAVSRVLDEFKSNTGPVKNLLLSRLMHVLGRFQKERGYVWIMEPRPGAVAFCMNGQLGLITGSNDNTEGIYTGIHLSAEKFGQPWQSKEPRVVGYIDSLLGGFNQVYD